MAESSGSFCSSTSTHYYPAAQQFSKTIYIFACVVIISGSISSTTGNIVILFALRKCQSLHPPSKALLCSLALTDLFVGIVVDPLFIAYYLMVILELPRYYCVIAITYARTSNFIGAVSLVTIATIAIDRYHAFRLRLRYRERVKLRRVVCVLVIEWILAAFWSGSWFWNGPINLISGAVGMFMCCLITPLCYLTIYRGFRHHVAQIHQQANFRDSTDFNVAQYKRTVNNMLWIYGILLLCYVPYLSSLFAIIVMGLNNATRFALHFSVIAIYFNSSLNPILYCWKIKELKENVKADLHALFNFVTLH
ncbi:histamine H2 receptor-like [Oculina patagonica]